MVNEYMFNTFMLQRTKLTAFLITFPTHRTWEGHLTCSCSSFCSMLSSVCLPFCRSSWVFFSTSISAYKTKMFKLRYMYNYSFYMTENELWNWNWVQYINFKIFLVGTYAQIWMQLQRFYSIRSNQQLEVLIDTRTYLCLSKDFP